MVVTYSYIMKMKNSEIIERLDEVLEYLAFKKKMGDILIVGDVERRLKMAGVLNEYSL